MRTILSGSFTVEILEPRRLFAAGDLDPTFGQDGSHVIKGITPSVASGQLFSEPNGGFLMIGFSGQVDQFNSDGTLKSSINLDSQHVVDNGDIISATPLKDGSFLANTVSTSFNQDNPDLNTYSNALMKFNADGSVDKSFNVYAAPVAQATPKVQPDGKYILAYEAVIRFLPSGILDPSFNNRTTGFSDGFEASEAQLQANGKIILFGQTNDPRKMIKTQQLRRLNVDGTIDTTFGESGTQAISVTPYAGNTDAAIGVTVLPNDALLVSYRSIGRIKIGRFSSNGQLDKTFGQSGFATVSFGNLSAANFNTSVQLMPDGRILSTALTVGLEPLDPFTFNGFAKAIAILHELPLS